MNGLRRRFKNKNIESNGFTLIEIATVIFILGLLSGGSAIAYRNQLKRAHTVELQLALNAASKNLTFQFNNDQTKIDNCLDSAGLNNGGKFNFQCSQRDDGSGIFDIHARPMKDIGVGGVMSFEDENKICWDTCDAWGEGEEATLAKNHLSINSNCEALTRRERRYSCNCRRATICKRGRYRSCGRRSSSAMWFIRPPCRWRWGRYCVRRRVCKTCRDIKYVNENGVAVDLS